ncbi:TPA: hypothetical protein LS257_004953 [Serratia liquefaciens]|nr:hypothetical protein [Serratia liquefaciens]
MRIEDEYKKTGYFWLPGDEEKKIPGVLSINDGGKIDLEILGLFDDSIISLNKDDFEIGRIIGAVEKDGLVTLDGCYYSKKSFSFGGISKSNITVNKVFSGAAWERDEAVTFNTFSFTIDCLDEWVGISGINVDNDYKNKTTSISYAPPEKISFALDNGMGVEICFAYTLPGFPNLKEAKITQRAYFRLKSEELCELKSFISTSFKVTSLMCFAMDNVVTMKDISATSSEIQKDGYQTPIKIYYQSAIYTEVAPKLNRHDMLFSYGIIKNNIQNVFNNWINAYEYLSPAFGLYFSTKTGAQKYLDGKFLALAQGLETYHRRTSNEKLMESEIFDSLVSTVLEACPNEHIDWLKGRLTHGNEINLSKRLKAIIEPFKEHLGENKDRKSLLRKIVNTRNYLTHYSQNLEDESAKGEELWILCSKIEAIFILHFLNVVGFNPEEIKGVIANCNQLQQKLNPI